MDVTKYALKMLNINSHMSFKQTMGNKMNALKKTTAEKLISKAQFSTRQLIWMPCFYTIFFFFFCFEAKGGSLSSVKYSRGVNSVKMSISNRGFYKRSGFADLFSLASYYMLD